MVSCFLFRFEVGVNLNREDEWKHYPELVLFRYGQGEILWSMKVL